MQTLHELTERLEYGRLNNALTALYGPDGDADATEKARQRCLRLVYAVRSVFSAPDGAPAALVSGPGRTELGGNHTDHQHGRVLCASVDLDALACVVRTGSGVVRLESEGYPRTEVDLARTDPVPSEKGTPAALIRGIAAQLKERGFNVCGLDVCMTSNVLSGSGLSSSAAFETLIANAFNCFCCDGALDAVEIARLGQYSENVYFGKPCGLMDQMACSLGGVTAIDFADPACPRAKRINTDGGLLPGYALCIIDTRSGHDDLTGEYAAITEEMGSVAAFFGRKYLRDVSEDVFMLRLAALRKLCGDRAVLRAMHFFEEDRRAEQEAQALAGGDTERFLELVNESGESSALKLQNVWAPGAPQTQPVSLTIETGRKLLGGKGAIRVHGGGFAGTVQAFVPVEELDGFIEGMEGLLGEGCCHKLRVRQTGGCVVSEM